MASKAEERNALAELAENLEHDNFFGCDHYKREVWVGKAQRIIAELAKVECVTDCDGNRICLHGSAFKVFERCFAIAEE